MIENDAFKLLLINLFHLNPDDIANILCTTFNKMMVLLVALADKHQACPYCGFTAPKIKEYVTKEITHSALTTQKCIIKYRARLQMSMLWKDLLLKLNLEDKVFSFNCFIFHFIVI